MPIFVPKTDNDYQNWINENSFGFVINTLRNPTSKYMVLHSHSCFTVRELSTVAGEEAFTGNEYQKICANSIKELEEWLKENELSFSKECQKCNPRDPEVISETDAKKIMSEYYKVSGDKYQRNKLKENREFIIGMIRRGVSVEEAFRAASEN